MNKANEILKNIELIESLLDLMNKASKAIMEVYEKPDCDVEGSDCDAERSDCDGARHQWFLGARL